MFDLFSSTTDSRSRGDDLRPDIPNPVLSTQPVNDHFVSTHHGAQRSGDEVQFILNNQAGGHRLMQPVLANSEESSQIFLPREHCKLVDGANQEIRRIGYQIFVNCCYRQRALSATEEPPAEFAVCIRALINNSLVTTRAVPNIPKYLML